MRESLFYQDILKEGRLSTLRQITPILRSWGVSVDRLLNMLGITDAELEEPEIQDDA